MSRRACVHLVCRPGPLRDLLVSGLTAIADRQHQTVEVVELGDEAGIGAWANAVAAQASDLLIVVSRRSIHGAAPEVKLRVPPAAVARRGRHACGVEPWASVVSHERRMTHARR